MPDSYCNAIAAQYQCALDYLSFGSNFLSGMAAGLMESCIPDLAGGVSATFGYTKFKLSTFAAVDVPGLCRISGKIYAGDFEFGFNMGQQTIGLENQTRNIFLYSSSFADSVYFAAY